MKYLLSILCLFIYINLLFADRFYGDGLDGGDVAVALKYTDEKELSVFYQSNAMNLNFNSYYIKLSGIKSEDIDFVASRKVKSNDSKEDRSHRNKYGFIEIKQNSSNVSIINYYTMFWTDNRDKKLATIYLKKIPTNDICVEYIKLGESSQNQDIKIKLSNKCITNDIIKEFIPGLSNLDDINLESIPNQIINEDEPISIELTSFDNQKNIFKPGNENISYHCYPSDVDDNFIFNGNIDCSIESNFLKIIPKKNWYGTDTISVKVSRFNDNRETISEWIHKSSKINKIAVTVNPINDYPNFSLNNNEILIKNNDFKHIYNNIISDITAGNQYENEELNFITKVSNEDIFLNTPTINKNGTIEFSTYPCIAGESNVEILLSDGDLTKVRNMDIIINREIDLDCNRLFENYFYYSDLFLCLIDNQCTNYSTLDSNFENQSFFSSNESENSFFKYKNWKIDDKIMNLFHYLNSYTTYDYSRYNQFKLKKIKNDHSKKINDDNYFNSHLRKFSKSFPLSEADLGDYNFEDNYFEIDLTRFKNLISDGIPLPVPLTENSPGILDEYYIRLIMNNIKNKIKLYFDNEDEAEKSFSERLTITFNFEIDNNINKNDPILYGNEYLNEKFKLELVAEHNLGYLLNDDIAPEDFASICSEYIPGYDFYTRKWYFDWKINIVNIQIHSKSLGIKHWKPINWFEYYTSE